MEDPDDDSETLGYSTEGNSGILNKGLTLGKRILVTGFVLSTAPVVIPPLAIVSALGIAVSVPFGLYLASYTCTEKLMSKLLQTPLCYPSLLDYGNGGYDREEVNSDGDEEKDGVSTLEKEEEEWMEDTAGCVEMRMELGEEVKEEEQADELVSPNNGYQQNFSTVNEEEPEREKEKGYDEDIGRPMVVENPPGSTGLDTEALRPEEEDDQVLEGSSEREPEMVYGAVINVIEGDERRLSDPTEAIDFPIEVTAVVGESTCLPTETSAEVDDFERETTGLIEKLRDKGRSDELAEDKKQPVSEMHQDVEHDNPRTSYNAGQMDIPSKDNMNASTESANVDIISREGQKCTVEGDSMHGVRENDDRANHLEGKQSQDGGTLVLSTDAKIEGRQEPIENVHDSSHQVHEQNPSNVGEGTADVSEIPVSTDMPMSGEAMKEIISEEKVWERINAMKIIVGYKAEPHPTCLEELRALYVFTGVEPPAFFNDATDLAEIDDKLSFLMTIVGVK